MMSQDTKRVKRRLIVSLVFLILSILFGFIIILASQVSPAGLSAGMIWIIIGSIPIVIALKGYKKVPPEEAYFIGSDKGTFPILGSLYWINDKGIWKNNELLVSWNEVKDIQVLTTWVETRTTNRFYNLAESVVYGVIKVFLNDGRSFEINNVIDPVNLVNYIKNVYIKKS